MDIKWLLKTLKLVSEQPDGKEKWQWASFLPLIFPNSKYPCFPIYIQTFFLLKEKYHRKIIRGLARAVPLWIIYYMEKTLSSSPENEMIMQQDFEFFPPGRTLNSVHREMLPINYAWTICLFCRANPEVTASRRTAFDILPLLPNRDVRLGRQ